MNKLLFVMPLMAISLLTNCNKGKKEYLECYTKVTYTFNGKLQYITNYEYNDKHLVSKLKRDRYSDEAIKEVLTTTYEYNVNNQVTCEKSIKEDKTEPYEIQTMTTTNTYDSHSNLTLIDTVIVTTQEGETREKKEQTKYTYDSSDNVVEEKKTRTDPDGAWDFDGKTIYTYDEQNRLLTESKYEYFEDEITEKATLTYEGDNIEFKTKKVDTYQGSEIFFSEFFTNTFDDKGKLVKQTIDLKDYKFELNYEYDNDGNLSIENGYKFDGGLPEAVLINTYQYLNGNPNKITFHYGACSEDYFGQKPNEVLIKNYDKYDRITYSQSTIKSGDTIRTSTYTYEYDQLIPA